MATLGYDLLKGEPDTAAVRRSCVRRGVVPTKAAADGSSAGSKNKQRIIGPFVIICLLSVITQPAFRLITSDFRPPLFEERIIREGEASVGESRCDRHQIDLSSHFSTRNCKQHLQQRSTLATVNSFKLTRVFQSSNLLLHDIYHTFTLINYYY